MVKIQELIRKYPVVTHISTYFVTTFITCSAIAWTFDRAMWEALLLASVMSVTSGVVAAVKKLDKNNESE